MFSVNAVEINSGGTDCVKTQLHIQVMDPLTVQDVDEFVSSSDLEKCSFHLRSPMNALLGLKMRVQTADKNITMIHKLSTLLQSIS